VVFLSRVSGAYAHEARVQEESGLVEEVLLKGVLIELTNEGLIVLLLTVCTGCILIWPGAMPCCIGDLELLDF
jgi:hypothetical protein